MGWSAPSPSQKAKLPRWTLRHWTQAAGLPAGAIHALALDGRGALWVGTSSGLFRFDGDQFFRQEGIPAGVAVLSLWTGADGRLYVGTDGHGLWIGGGEGLAHVGGLGLAEGHVRALVQDRPGRLWMGTNYGLWVREGETWTPYGMDQGLPDNLVTGLALDSQGRVWVSTLRGGLAVSVGREWLVPQAWGRPIQGGLALVADGRGGVWTGGFNGLFAVVPGRDLLQAVEAAGEMPVPVLAPDNEGLWFYTPGEGLGRLQNGAVAWMTDVLSRETTPQCLLSDSWGGLWIGTASDGLYRLSPSGIAWWGREQGLPDGVVTTLAADGRGGLWAGTQNSGVVYRGPDGRIRRFGTREGLNGLRVTALAGDGQGGVWAATEDGGLNRVFQGDARSMAWDGPDARRITALTADSHDGLRIGTEREGYFWTPASGVRGGLPPAAVHQWLADGAGGLLAATEWGVWRLTGDQALLTGPDSTLDARCLLKDHAGTLWIGSQGQGLWREDSTGRHRFTRVQGLPDDRVWGMVQDGSGLLWMTTPQGLLAFDPDTVTATTARLVPRLIDGSDGLPGAPSGPLALETADWLAVATDRGVARLPLPWPADTMAPAAPRLTLHGRGTIQDRKGRFKVPSGAAPLRVVLDAPDAAQGHRLRFFYTLTGPSPVEGFLHPGTARTLSFPELKPGTYRLRVWSFSPEGIASPAATLAWTVTASHPWPWLLAVFVLLALAAWGFRRLKAGRSKPTPKYQTSTLRPDLAEAALVRLESLMAGERLYLDPDLSLKTLAQRCRVHPNHLSRVINERFGMGYNDYINRQRIDTAKALLDESAAGRPIQEIMEASGFYSKSVFNTAFKRWVGVTPSEYRRRPGSES